MVYGSWNAKIILWETGIGLREILRKQTVNVNSKDYGRRLCMFFHAKSKLTIRLIAFEDNVQSAKHTDYKNTKL